MSVTPGSSASDFAWVFFLCPLVYRKAAEVGLLPAAQLGTARHLSLHLIIAGKKGGDKVGGAYWVLTASLNISSPLESLPDSIYIYTVSLENKKKNPNPELSWQR